MHRFVHLEGTQPEAIYFTQPYPDGSVVDYSWREVGNQARRMAAYLRSLQLPPASAIAIVGKNSAHWIMADLAIWMAGHVSVPLYSTMGTQMARYIFEHCEPRLLFVGKLDGKTDGWNEIRMAIPEGMPLVGLPMSPVSGARDVPQWDEITARSEPIQDIHQPEPGDLATIIYTSGTTGAPKGVMHSFGGMMAYALGAGEFCRMTPRDRMLSYLPLAHAAERAFVEANSLCHGVHVYFSDSLETFAQDLQRARPTLFISMPRLWTKFYGAVCARLPLRKQKLLFALPIVSGLFRKKILRLLGLDAVRIAFTGSAPLAPEITGWYRSLGLELLDVYGMSEDFCWSHYSRPGLVRMGYSGQTLPGVERRIDDNGEILIKSITGMMGYYKQPELTAQCMTADGFFRTGDRGEVDEIGRLKITGRVKDIFKTSKGKYIAPAPIENQLTHPMVEAVCVAGAAQDQPFALAMLSVDGRKQLLDLQGKLTLTAELETMLEHVNAALEKHEKLDYLVVVNELWSADNGFLTPTMKIRRNAIEERYVSKVAQWAAAGAKVVFDR
ncbi:AMP-binding acetyl-CoA synthetase [Ramlibacter tataouinensis]|uniref:AMP-binding acetyl-CoA synthetase n=1 Tax=Ramlibacter tataouinensis TaxID=94132 RepID=A0A127JZZ0_9BURK|nr:AMP-binding acetyl-CoA synthetase [Ramlibacter tataouinensis]